MIHRQPHFRAQVIHNNQIVAITRMAWPLNAGCGQAAAIGEAEALIAALQTKAYFDPISTKATPVIDVPSNKGENNLMVKDYFTIFGLIMLSALVAMLAVGCRLEQSSLNPATQVCDATGYRPSCVEVSHAR
jgi:hypothetical protein